MTQPTASTGIVPRILARLFGPRATRLRERIQSRPLLSYLLVCIVSLTMVLVFGKSEVRMIFAASLIERIQGIAFTSILIGVVYAADLAALDSLVRIPVLARNRQRGAKWEHIAYVALVITTESITYGVALVAAGRNPQSLNPLSNVPILPTSGPIFYTVIGLRVVQLAWTIVQLVVVNSKLPVLLSTLTGTGKEIVGAHVEKRLAQLDIEGVSLPAGFRVYAAMSKPPRRVRTWWNGWLVRRELAAEEEEERQVQYVVDALEDLERRQGVLARTSIVEEYTDPNIIAINRAPDPTTPTPSSRRARRRRRRPAEPAAPKVRAALEEQPDLGVRATARKAGVAPSTASRYHTRRATTSTPAAEAIAQ